MPCDQITFKLEAFVDGECGADDRKMISDHLESCATCRQHVDELRALNNTISAGLVEVKAPSDLWQRIEAQLPGDLDDYRPAKIRPWSKRPIWQMAIAASLLVMLALPAGWTWQWMRQDNSLIIAPIQDFSTYRDSGRSLDIASRDPEIIHNWFTSKLTFEAPKLKANIAGFNLVGGRLCWLLKRRLSAFAYQRGGQALSLYVMKAHDLILPSGTFDPELGIILSSHEIGDFRTMIWRAGDLVYAVVSDISNQDMSIFLAALARSQMAASGTIDPSIADERMNSYSAQALGNKT
ncbi:MAG: anti-sigma factor family protein [Geminicoccaceae bacterium]